MNDEEPQTIRARLLQEWTQNQRELDGKRADAARLGEIFQYLAATLQAEPERVSFVGERPLGRYIDLEIPVVDLNDLNLTRLRALRDSIRTVMERQEALTPLLTAFDLPAAEKSE